MPEPSWRSSAVNATTPIYNEITEAEINALIEGVPTVPPRPRIVADREPTPLIAVVNATPISAGRGLGANDGDIWPERPNILRHASEIQSTYEVLRLDQALATEWSSDAHAVPYVIVDRDGQALSRQPRLKMDGLRLVRATGYDVRITSLWADIDNPGHARWTPDLEHHALPRIERIETALFYMSRAGLRLVQPLDRWLSVEEFVSVHPGWLARIESITGLKPDRACKDWTRHYRLPHVVRDGVCLEGKGKWTWTPISPPVAAKVAEPIRTSERSRLLASLGRPDGAEGRARRYLDKVPTPTCGSGECNKAAFRVAVVLVGRFGLDDDSALELLEAWAGSSHPWRAGELLRKVRDARKAVSR